MNVLFLLTHKSSVIYLYDDYTIRQALERMEPVRYATIPVLKRTGEYVGTITEGDLLWAIKNNYMLNMHDAETHPITEVARRKDYLPATVTATPEELLKTAIDQNFVPMVDDRNIFIGLVTRQSLLEYCMSKIFSDK